MQVNSLICVQSCNFRKYEYNFKAYREKHGHDYSFYQKFLSIRASFKRDSSNLPAPLFKKLYKIKQNIIASEDSYSEMGPEFYLDVALYKTILLIGRMTDEDLKLLHTCVAEKHVLEKKFSAARGKGFLDHEIREINHVSSNLFVAWFIISIIF